MSQVRFLPDVGSVFWKRFGPKLFSRHTSPAHYPIYSSKFRMKISTEIYFPMFRKASAEPKGPTINFDQLSSSSSVKAVKRLPPSPRESRWRNTPPLGCASLTSYQMEHEIEQSHSSILQSRFHTRSLNS